MANGKREELQKAALDAWIGNNCNGALILGTGFGKTKIAIDAIKDFDESCPQVPKILWLTNSELLRDVDTPADFIKWDALYLMTYIQFECIQTAYRWEDTHWDLVIADEGDFMLTPEYFKFFTNNKFSNILFLTATVDKHKQDMLDSLCKTVFRYTTTEAQSDGILNKSNITLVNFDLDKTDKYIKSTGKGKKVFYQTENDAYEYIDRRCNLEAANVQNAKNSVDNETILFGKPSKELVDILGKCGVVHKFWTTKRANFLWSLKSSRIASKKLLKANLLGEGNEDNKALVFCKRTEQAELICKYTYHSKNKKDNENLDLLSKGDINAVAVVQAVNRGVNLVGVTHIIKESYDGSSTSFQQQHGRGTRLSPESTMKMFILVPYFTNKKGVRKPTQALKWAKDMTVDFSNLNVIES